MSGTPTNPEATEAEKLLSDLAACAAETDDEYGQRWPYNLKVKIEREEARALIDAFSSLLTERDALRQRVSDHERVIEKRGKEIDRQAARAEDAEATLTRYQNVHAQIKDPSYVGNYSPEEVVEIYRKWIAALDGPKENVRSCDHAYCCELCNQGRCCHNPANLDGPKERTE